MRKIPAIYILLLSFFLIILIFSFEQNLLISLFIKSKIIAIYKTFLLNNAIVFSEVLEDYFINPDIQKIDAIVDNLAKETNIRVTAVDINGNVLGDSRENPFNMENHGGRPEIVSALKEGWGESLRYSTTLNEWTFYLAHSIKKEGRTVGIVRVSVILKEIETILKGARLEVIKASLIVLFISILISILLSFVLSTPVRRLKGVFERLAKGDYSVRALRSRVLELDTLASGFNEMVLMIKNAFKEVEEKRKELVEIIDNLKEGLMVLSREGKILQANKSFKEMVGIEKIEERFFWEVLRIPDFKELFEEIKKKEFISKKEMLCRERIYQTSCVRVEDKFIFVFNDISELKQIEKIKRDLITNVAHELKTPLTAIKGFGETLWEDIKDEENKRYIEIIIKHTDRLIKIVSDLLLLSKLEDKRFELEMVDADISEIASNVVKLFESNVRAKNLNFEVFIEKPLILKGDPFYLEQMLINLLDNAIKYTEKGTVGLEIKKESKFLKIEIYDTGIGIAKSHIPRIFERFYVVDPARSKEKGGTGLGLSIVKHIVELHNGEIKVDSKVGKGSRFIIILPF